MNSKSIKSSLASLRSEIDEIQFGPSSRYVIFSHDPTGLGGQISRRILALRVGLMTKRTVIFPEEDFYPYNNAFLPLYPSYGEANNIILSEKSIPKIDQDRFLSDNRSIVSFDFWEFWGNIELRNKVYNFVPQQLSHLDNTNILTDGALFSCFELNEFFSSSISGDIDKIKALGDVIGIHFRRGDKYVETPYVSSDEYKLHLNFASRDSGITNIFLSSDDPNADEEIDTDKAKYNMFFDKNEKRYNNANHKFLMNNPSLARQETVTAIKNIYMLSHCKQIVGQSNAHFARLAAGYISNRDATQDFGYLIEPRANYKQFHKKIAYSLYKGTRSIAKYTFPFLGLKKAKRR